MYHFCTLFDKNYFTRGLALYESLRQHCSDFHLYIFCFDEDSFQILSTLSLPHVTLISLNEFEDAELLSVKPDRSKAEYCWTSTPSTILYVLKNYQVPSCTYVDADIYFYSNPAVLIEEMQQSVILLTEHRYTARYDNAHLSGKFCVQFMTFKNKPDSLEALNWWRQACLAWCYNRVEDGKFGDQKYLDDWCTRFSGVHVSEHLGGGIAPWNVQQYHFLKKTDKLQCTFRNQAGDVIFYHFHGLKLYRKLRADLGQYQLNSNVIKWIYLPYLKHLYNISKKLESKLENPFVDAFAVEPTWIQCLKRFAKGSFNILNLERSFENV